MQGAEGDGNVAEILDGFDFTLGLHAEFRTVAGQCQVAAGNVGILAPDGGNHVIGGDVVGAQLVGIEPDADLPLAPAEDDDLADAGYALQALLDGLVGEFRQVTGRHVARQHHRQDRFRIGVDLLDDGLLGVLRQVAQREVDLVAYVLGFHVAVLAEAELDHDDRSAFEALRGERLDAADRVDLGFDRVGDVGFNGVGACALEHGLDRHIGEFNAGKQVDADALERHPAERDERADQHDRKDGAAYR